MKKLFSITVTVGLLLTACQKNLLDTSPYGSIGADQMWSSDSKTDLGVIGIYNALRLGQNTGGASGLEIYQYDQYSYVGQTRDGTALMEGTITPSAGLFSDNWRNFYEGVLRANDAIYNIPLKSPSADTKKARLIAEAKFLRAYFYFRLNQVWKGVPIYLEPTNFDAFTKPRETERAVWDQVISDLTDCINEAQLPNKYAKGDANYGRATKGAAYALRGKVYMYTQEWDKAIADFEAVKTLGFRLFNDYKLLFKEANEQSEEMIFSIQNTGVPGLGSTTQFFCGTRASFGSCWNSYLVSPNVVDLHEYMDGSAFNWDDVLPGFSSLTPQARQAYFLRDGLTDGEINGAINRGADMSLYLPNGNEARLRQAFANRDPRLEANVITPYAGYLGFIASTAQVVYSRFPYRNESNPIADLRTDSQTFFYYLHRKFVGEGASELLNRSYGPIDLPLIRYADVLLMKAEAMLELGDVAGALAATNEVRARVGLLPLQNTDASLGTFVADPSALRERIRNERRIEFLNEGINYFDELRWKTWHLNIFKEGNGIKQIWGQVNVRYNFAGEHLYAWAIPQVERERNPSLTQNPGWEQ
jgi:hypothetical protein